MINFRFSFCCTFLIMLLSFAVSAQLAEIKPFDTTKNDNAASDRIFADALKEKILGNSKEAEALFLRFAEAKPKVSATYYELARINLKENNAVKAQQNIQKAISLDTGNKWYWELLGNLLANSNKYDSAAQIFSKLARNHTPNEDYLLKSSLLYKNSKNYKRAIEELEKLVEQRGPDEETLVQISQLYLKLNKVDDAAKAIQKIIDANPKEGRYYALLAEMYLNNNNETKAKQIYIEAEQKFPEDITIQLGLASYYKRQKNIEKYTEYVNKTIANSSIDDQTQLTLLISYLQDEGKDSLARQNAMLQVEKLLAKKPNNAVLLGLYGDLLSMQNQQMKAAEAYKRSLKIDNNNLNIWQQLLFTLSDKNDADSLIFYSREALSLFPSSAMIHYLNGIGYVNKKFYDKGIKSFQTAIDFQPEDNKDLLAEMYSSLADAQHAHKDYVAADKSFDEALKLKPDNASVLNNYAYYLSVRKVRLEDAEKYSKKSLELKPGEPTFLDTYGWIFYQQGKYEKARELIDEAIKKNGKEADATLYEHLGDVYYKLGNINDALKNWNIAQEKDAQNEILNSKIKNKKIDE